MLTWRLNTALLGMYGGLQSTPASFPRRCCRGSSQEPSTTCRHAQSAASEPCHRIQNLRKCRLTHALHANAFHALCKD